ncbi:MAG: hypothetical protein ACFB02_17010 [Mastigocoleus sp.]
MLKKLKSFPQSATTSFGRLRGMTPAKCSPLLVRCLLLEELCLT